MPSAIKGIAVHTILLVSSIVIAFPFLWMLTNSIKTKAEIWQIPPKLLPSTPQWNNYAIALADGTLFTYIWNSTYTSAIITVIVLINSAMFAYAITNIKFKGRNLLFVIVMITYMMPVAATYVPDYIIISRMGLINTHTGYILSCTASIFTIFFFRQAFMQIDKSIFEAAKIDGADHKTILWHIVAPMSSSSFATLGIFTFVGSYNNYLWSSLILKDQKKYLVSMGIQAFFSAEGSYGLNWGAIMAACCVIVLPLLLIFFIGEKWIINGITSDAVIKG